MHGTTTGRDIFEAVEKSVKAEALISEQLRPEKLGVFTVSIVKKQSVTERLLHENELCFHCVSLSECAGRGAELRTAAKFFSLRVFYQMMEGKGGSEWMDPKDCLRDPEDYTVGGYTPGRYYQARQFLG
ncbi:unnamed protein product [Pleuronectes platessa]|uniref:Uncharacterized protein n=1 Tax=Pleuronectes platessa TaxID=8262 RepID=A0A9N7UJT3_PLEPL|nr:unnamed protein product [Pleuronectes platessa]